MWFHYNCSEFYFVILATHVCQRRLNLRGALSCKMCNKSEISSRQAHKSVIVVGSGKTRKLFSRNIIKLALKSIRELTFFNIALTDWIYKAASQLPNLPEMIANSFDRFLILYRVRRFTIWILHKKLVPPFYVFWTPFLCFIAPRSFFLLFLE